MAAVGYLVHINDPNDCHELLNADISIGRSDDNDVVLPDKSVSSKVLSVTCHTCTPTFRVFKCQRFLPLQWVQVNLSCIHLTSSCEQHAKIVFDTHRGSNRITLSDVGSRNATFVNRVRTFTAGVSVKFW